MQTVIFNRRSLPRLPQLNTFLKGLEHYMPLTAFPESFEEFFYLLSPRWTVKLAREPSPGQTRHLTWHGAQCTQTAVFISQSSVACDDCPSSRRRRV